MLLTLRIKNLALVTDLTVDLQPGYNVITGETGAGKSIIIGALNLVLGERADRTLIRDGSDSCSVEAVFDVGKFRATPHPALSPIGGESVRRTGEGVRRNELATALESFLEQNGLDTCEDNQLVLKRTFTAAGANRQFINGSPTSV